MTMSNTAINDLEQWLQANRIDYARVDDEVVEIKEFGKMFVQDNEQVPGIFRKNIDDEIEFNCIEDIEVLFEENIFYVAFKFGDNWYYTDLRGPVKLNIIKYIGKCMEPVRKEKYVNLGVHTGFELLNGSGLPNDWVRKAKWLGMDAIGVAEQNTMASHFQLQQDCAANEMKHVFGYSLTFMDDNGDKVDGRVYVQTQKGLKNLLRIQKAIMVDSDNQTIPMNELLARSEGNAFVFGKLSSFWMDKHYEIVEVFMDRFDAVYFQIDLSEYLSERFDRPVLDAAKRYFDVGTGLYDLVPPVLLTDCYYLDKSDSGNKIILNKTATGAAHMASEDQYFKTVDEQFESFQALFDPEHMDVEALFAECCESTLEIADNATAFYRTDKNFMPKYDLTPEELKKYGTSHNMFNQLLEEGLQKLVPAEQQERYRRQMEYEKYVIESTDNVDYLLIQWDTVNWCRRQGIFVGAGRGSAAGCLLLYLLGLTLVDPIKYNLIFERFLLPERAGLYPAEVTVIDPDKKQSSDIFSIELENGKTIDVTEDSEFMVKRGDLEPMRIKAKDLQEGDDILFDNRDEIFTINEI